MILAFSKPLNESRPHSTLYVCGEVGLCSKKKREYQLAWWAETTLGQKEPKE